MQPRYIGLVRRQTRALALACIAMGLVGCAVGPDYVRPDVEVPAAYKELDGWKTARPAELANRGQWWTIFGDPQLDALEAQVDISNQNVRAAEAQFREARALVQEARAAWFPSVSGNASFNRSGSSGASGSSSIVGGPQSIQSASGTAASAYTLSFDASWEADVWGRIRRTVEASQANAQASAADLAAARLSAQATLATDYLSLRAADAQKQLLDDTVAAFEKSLQLTRNQYAGGIAARSAVAQAEAQLETTRAQAIDVGVSRAQFEHAIALLIGRPASSFAIAPRQLAPSVPTMPAGLPSELLERRPDVAAAERQAAAANAQIGVARAAFFPTLMLSASAGFESAGLANLFSAPGLFWSLGPAVAQTIFDAGLRQAQSEQARAAYDAAVAAYRQSVLAAFQQVEDELAALRILAQEAQVQDRAVKAAQESVALTLNQYKEGIVSYLSVVTVQTIALSNQRTAVTILGQRLNAGVLLIEALGGGWSAAELHSTELHATELPLDSDARDLHDDGDPRQRALAREPLPTAHPLTGD